MSFSLLLPALGALALVLLGAALWLFWTVAPFFYWLRALLGLALLMLSLGVAGALWELHHVTPVTGVEPVASVSVTQLAGGRRWRVTLFPRQGPELSAEVRGDLWQLDGRVLSVQPWMQSMNLSPALRPKPPAGRSLTLEEPRPGVGSLSEPAPMVDWPRLRASLLYPLFQAQSASPVIAPLRDGAVFDLWLSDNQLVAEPANSQAEKAWKDWQSPRDGGISPLVP
ncbi:MAG: hypothetical protein R3296_11355 [Oleiphilaceae bacterium]|nr:hypothetical protein [Oleiphilaceae bacterium]